VWTVKKGKGEQNILNVLREKWEGMKLEIKWLLKT
jgi:hypothetical protein